MRLQDPLLFPKLKALQKPRLIGSGGGGAVFSFDDSKVVVKVSWSGSTKSVERECAILETLERNSVQGVERCLGQVQYPGDKRRVMIALAPLVENAVANPTEIGEELLPRAVDCIIQTMVQMLASNVVTVDVQPLISKDTGDVLFIDFTEAVELASPLSFMDSTLVSSFCTEMAALIPNSLLPVASESLLRELQSLEKRNVILPTKVYEALCAQPFASDEISQYVDAILSRHE